MTPHDDLATLRQLIEVMVDASWGKPVTYRKKDIESAAAALARVEAVVEAARPVTAKLIASSWGTDATITKEELDALAAALAALDTDPEAA